MPPVMPCLKGPSQVRPCKRVLQLSMPHRVQQCNGRHRHVASRAGADISIAITAEVQAAACYTGM